MKKIGLIVPYFGKLPNNFQIWLNSCEKNPSVNWFIFTNDRSEYAFPSNVKVNYWEYSQMVKIFENHFDFPLCLQNPYKLTDFKVAYGEIFKDYLIGFDFWGYCDIDLIFGNIRKFITDDLLNTYDKILSNGHFTLFRNTEEINALYKKPMAGIQPYKEVFSNPQHYYFDEWGANGINYIFGSVGIDIYQEIVFHDVFPRKYRFFSSQLKNKLNNKNNNIYFWDNGSLYRYYFSPQKEVVREEILYAHFLRRKMKTVYNKENARKVLMVPNSYQTLAHDPDSKSISQLLKSINNRDYLKFWYFHAKRKLLK